MTSALAATASPPHTEFTIGYDGAAERPRAARAHRPLPVFGRHSDIGYDDRPGAMLGEVVHTDKPDMGLTERDTLDWQTGQIGGTARVTV
jgi:hypothetical protein